MRWSVVKLIAAREARDLLRDRRTLVIMLGLPLILYPVLGGVGLVFAINLLELPSRVGVVGRQHLPPPDPTPRASDVLAFAGAAGTGDLWSAATLAVATRATTDPPLLVAGRFPAAYAEQPRDAELLQIIDLPDDDPRALAERRVDVILTIPSDFAARLRCSEPVRLKLQEREGDDVSKQAVRRLAAVLKSWKKHLKEVRFLRRGLPADFDEPFTVEGSPEDRPDIAKKGVELRTVLARLFPFIIVMWTLAGALHPAIDLCAGEKERGTMETLLLSPATRPEVVAGKFLAVWGYSSAAALWNLLFLGGGAWLGGRFLAGQLGENFALLRLSGLGWCAATVFPMAALFSALGLGLGAFARSSKEGQYYLMPLFLVTMPLLAMSLAPGAELSLGYSLLPVTGQAMLLQKLLNTAEPTPWLYFAPVLGSLALYIALALRWAVRQFRREEVLFRDTDRLGLGDLVRGLFRRGARTP
jgi:sodium transport system permease protein